MPFPGAKWRAGCLPHASQGSRRHGVAAGLRAVSSALFAAPAVEVRLTPPAILATAAQADVLLVGNFGERNPSLHNRAQPLSQRFDTGAEPLGYVLTSVQVAYEDNQHDPVSAKVCTVTGEDQPTSTCTDFNPPDSFSPSGHITFTAPGIGMFLAQETKHAVVLTPDEPGTLIIYNTTASDDEQSGSLSDWNIAGEYRFYNGTTWSDALVNRSIMIRLRGFVRTPRTP